MTERGNTRRIRVVQAVLDLEAGGLERVVADLARRLDPARFDVHVLALRFLGRHAEGLEHYATLHVAPPLPSWTMLWPRPLQKTLEAIAPDVVHTHSGAWYKTAIAASRAGVRAIVHTEHGRPEHDPWPGRFIEYLASRRTNTLIAVSPNLQEKMRPAVARSCEIEVIVNGVDTDLFLPDRFATEWRERLGVSSETRVIGCVARLDPIKNFPMLLEALATLRRDWPTNDPPVLVIAGDGPERTHIAELVSKWELDGAVHCVGWVGPTIDLYPMFDVFTLSSRSEGTSIALLEAMSCGVCPVVTAVGGNIAVLGPELRELLVPSEAPAELARRWRSVLVDSGALRAYGVAARQRVISHYSLEAMVRNHEALYARLGS
ncbi:MAG: glycosyltransferase [bacterium]